MRRRVTRWDVFFGAMIVLLLALQAGYFYHGIYLGPRYLYEALPFLLLLTARGATSLADVSGRAARWAWAAVKRPTTKRTATVTGWLAVAGLLVALIACNALYYLPRQATLRANYSGLPIWEPVDVGAIYAFQQPRALVVTDDRSIYNYVLFPLNDPDLADPDNLCVRGDQRRPRHAPGGVSRPHDLYLAGWRRWSGPIHPPVTLRSIDLPNRISFSD